MAGHYSVDLERIIKEFSLEILLNPGDLSSVLIKSADLNRPGLPLAGFFEHFDNQRILIIGRTELAFLQNKSPEYQKESLERLLSRKPPVLIITRGIKEIDKFLESAQKYEVPVLRTNESTSSFMSSLISLLNVELAPRITRHGVLVEVYGEGVLILGESGVGKSETAIELIKRGHRLIADDAVEIRRVSNKTLVGTSPENIRHFVELRGIGIVNARRLFGIGAVKMTEKIDMIIQIELWEPKKTYERMGIDNEYLSILGIEIPSITIPVKPGRNLAIIIEVAAMNNRQKRMGYNAAQELLQRLGMTQDSEENIKWSSLE